VRQLAVRMCLAAGLGIFLPALPVVAEVVVLPPATAGQSAAGPAAGDRSGQATNDAAPANPAAGHRLRSSELLLLLAGLAAVGVIALRRS